MLLSHLTRQELICILSTMTIPEDRKSLTEENLRWMWNNLGMKNNNRPDFDRAMYCIGFLLSQ